MWAKRHGDILVVLRNVVLRKVVIVVRDGERV